MSIYENLELFQNLISCSHSLYLWCFSTDLTLRHTSCPEDLVNGYKFFLSYQTQLLVNHAKNAHYPFIMESFLNVLWIADFYREDDVLKEIYMLGPIFTGNYSYQRIKDKLDNRSLSLKTQASIIRQIEEIPIIPTNILFEYAIMLHYCICGEKISFKNFQFSSEPISGDEMPQSELSDSHSGIWASEQVLLNMVRNGNADYIDALSVSSSLSSGLRVHSGDSLREAKNNGLVLLVLVSRAAIEGGLNPDTAYTLCDYYASRLEDTDIVTELANLCNTMLEDYIQRVRSIKENHEVSLAVQSCCDYITVHVFDELSIDLLASRAGYTKYYFSRKFRQETGISIHDFINREKVKKAQIMLRSTNMSTLEISMELGFRSRSYFSEVFRKNTGISPGEYRSKNTKI